MATQAAEEADHGFLTTGERVALLRRRAKLSQKGLAAAIGISEPALSNYERDERPLPGEVARLLALRFNCSTDYLLRLKATPP
jgi:transcriptional regulator with XRE-family HTH domain